jgi:hypothetical protein
VGPDDTSNLPVMPGCQPDVPNVRQVAGRNGLVARSTMQTGRFIGQRPRALVRPDIKANRYQSVSLPQRGWKRWLLGDGQVSLSRKCGQAIGRVDGGLLMGGLFEVGC